MVFHDWNEKRKANTNNKCYNCHKLGHFGQDCLLPDKRLNRIEHLQKNSGSKSGLQISNNQNNKSHTPIQNNLQILNKGHQTAENNNNSNPKPFELKSIGIAIMVKDQQL